MARELTKTVRLEGGVLLSPKNKRWERQFKALPKEVQAQVIAKGAVREIAEDDDDEEEETVPVANLADHLESIDSVDEVKALAKADKRVTAKPIYEARIKALEG